MLVIPCPRSMVQHPDPEKGCCARTPGPQARRLRVECPPHVPEGRARRGSAFRFWGPRATTASMKKPRRAAALETQILLELIAKVKIAVALESGVVDLKCPCGMVILPPTPIISNLKAINGVS